MPTSCCIRTRRLLALVGLAKWLMVHSQLRLACNACSGIMTLYALHLQDTPQAAGMASPNLLLFGSYCWTPAAPDALRDAAQVLLAARAKPTCSTSQQGNESVGSWPSDVLQLTTLAAALPHGVTLAQLLQWLPQIVVAAAACLGYPDQAPPELMRVTAAALMDVLLGTVPGAPSTAAANLLAQALRSGHAQRWLSYMGKPAWLLNRWLHRLHLHCLVCMQQQHYSVRSASCCSVGQRWAPGSAEFCCPVHDSLTPETLQLTCHTGCMSWQTLLEQGKWTGLQQWGWQQAQAVLLAPLARPLPLVLARCVQAALRWPGKHLWWRAASTSAPL